jgi:chromosome partitioning protein
MIHWQKMRNFTQIKNNFTIMKIAVTNLKGGVGKTTIATNLAAALTMRGKTVCVVDTDLNQHSSMEWATNRSEDKPHVSVFGIMGGQLTAEIKKLRESYEYVILDGTPHVSELAKRTMIVADIVVIPISPSIYDFRAFEAFLEHLEEVNRNREEYGLERTKSVVVMNRMNDRAKIGHQIVEAVKHYDVQILNTRLVNRTAYADTATDGIGVVEGKDPKAKEEFFRFTDEIENIVLELKNKAK